MFSFTIKKSQILSLFGFAHSEWLEPQRGHTTGLLSWPIISFTRASASPSELLPLPRTPFPRASPWLTRSPPLGLSQGPLPRAVFLDIC